MASAGTKNPTSDKPDKEREARLAPVATAIKAGKALLTRRINGAEQKLAQVDKVPPSRHFISVLEESQSQIREAARRLEESYTKISTLDEAVMF